MLSRRHMRWHPRLILSAVIVTVIAVRLLLPYLILQRLNSYLATFSPVYSVHIGDLDISLLSLSYEFHDLDAKYKANQQNFFQIDSALVTMAWPELLRLRILTDVSVDHGRFTLTQALIDGSLKPEAKIRQRAQEVADALFFPVRVALVDIRNSFFDFSDFVRQAPLDQWRLFQIGSKIQNITPTQYEPTTSFTLTGTLLDSGHVDLWGSLKRLQDPLAWKVNVELLDFKLASANAMLLRLIPFSFAKGTLDTYGEIRSQNDQTEGYIKPFFSHVEVIKPNQKFKSIKHFAFEILGALANLILRNSGNKTVATRVAFRLQNGKLHIDDRQVIKKAFKNGFEEPLHRSIDHSLELK